MLLAVVAVLASLAGWAFAYVRYQGEIAGLRATLDSETRNASERLGVLEDSLHDSFAHLSNQALSRNNALFLDLAGQVLERERGEVHAASRENEQTVAGIVEPLHRALYETRQQLGKLEANRREAEGALGAQITGLLRSQQTLEKETRNLVNSLRRPEVRGRWGEMTLRRLVELAGMSERCDFIEQPTVQSENGQLRPDMVIHLPGKRQVVVDVKTPLDAYLSAVEADDSTTREAHLARHAKAVRERVDELARKRYWQQFDDSLDFVVLFIPGEQFLSAALDRDRDLLERALAKRVILATPSSLVGLLRAIAYGWKQETLNDNALDIRKAGEELIDRLAVFATHIDGVGKGLDGAVATFNRMAGSFESRVLPTARRLEDLGIAPPQTVPSAQPVERRSRGVQKFVVPQTTSVPANSRTDENDARPEQTDSGQPKTDFDTGS